MIDANWGGLRKFEPVSRKFGMDRGTAIDRFYIERFLDRHQGDIRGRVLEIGEPAYTRQFGGPNVAESDVLHATEGNRKATIIGDLATGQGIPHNAFDCIILTQVLPYVFDTRGALATCHRALKPGGVILATVNGISQISRYDMDRWGDFWRFTNLSARTLFQNEFTNGSVEVKAHGNALVATAFVQGFSLEELRPEELETDDPDYEVSITIRACRGPVS